VACLGERRVAERYQRALACIAHTTLIRAERNVGERPSKKGTFHLVEFARHVTQHPIPHEPVVGQGRARERGLVVLQQLSATRQPDDAQAHFMLGSVREQSGDREGAIASYRRAAELDPSAFEARNNLAMVLLDRDARAEASDLLRKAHAIFAAALGAEHPHTLAVGATLDSLKPSSSTATGTEATGSPPPTPWPPNTLSPAAFPRTRYELPRCSAMGHRAWSTASSSPAGDAS